MTTYEILQPNAYDTSEFAGTRSGTWEPVPDGTCDTIEEARATIAELQESLDWGTLAIIETGGDFIEEIYPAARVS